MGDAPLFRSGERLERVAVFRALQLGDMLNAIPALRALRRALPAAEVTLIALPWAEELARRFPQYIDRFVPFPGFPRLPEQQFDPRAFASFLCASVEYGYDLALQLHGDGRTTNIATALLGARLLAGHVPAESEAIPRHHLEYADEGHETRRCLRLIEALGAPTDDGHLEFPVFAEDRAALAGVFDAAGGPYAVVHPGASHPPRRWPVERFAEVAAFLAARGMRVVVTGGAAESGLAAELSERAALPVANLAGGTTLGALAALLAGATLVVSNDTGVAHLAAAVRARGVVVFQASDPARWAPLDRDRQRVVARDDLLGAGWGLPVPVEAVLAAVELQLRSATRA